MATLTTTERERDAARKAAVRKAGQGITIPFPESPERRRACLDDPERFHTTYFPHVFWQGFTPDRREMVEAIRFAAVHGGDQSVAGPRGEGKTTLAIFEAFRLMLRGEVGFPLIVTKNGGSAEEAMETLTEEIEGNDLLAADFPEICAPIRELDGWASKARKQHVDGHKPKVIWKKSVIALPTIPTEVLRRIDPRWKDLESCAAGQLLACVGIEGRIRGRKVRSRRPDLAIVDDVDDRESAKSETLTGDREKIIDSDVAGLAGPGKRVSRVMLCTLLNRTCVAFKYTDPRQKPSWNGRRLRSMLEEPTRRDLWDEYVDRRRSAMESGKDKLGRAATAFYLERFEEMNAGAVMSNPENFDRKLAEDGQPMQHSALQAFFDLVADVGWDAVNTEYQQDPPEEGGPEADDLNETVVKSRLSHVPQREIPAHAEKLVAFVDLHKRRLNWGVATWAQGGIGDVIDHGEKETYAPDVVGAEKAIRVALDELADEIEGKSIKDGYLPYCKADGQVLPLEVGLVDSGNWNSVVYDFCQDRGGVWRPSMGDSKYHQPPTRTMQKVPGERWYRSRQKTERGSIWVVNMDADHWKGWAHERLRTEPFEQGTGKRRRGSVALFGEDPKAHAEFARQVLAERLVREFVESGQNPGWREKWKTFSRNNHYLDVLYGLCVAGSVAGIRLAGEGKPKATATAAAKPGGWFANQKGG